MARQPNARFRVDAREFIVVVVITQDCHNRVGSRTADAGKKRKEKKEKKSCLQAAQVKPQLNRPSRVAPTQQNGPKMELRYFRQQSWNGTVAYIPTFPFAIFDFLLSILVHD